MTAVIAGAFALLGALYSGAQYWLGRRILYRGKTHFVAYYVLERIILDLLFLVVVMVVYHEGLLYAALGLVVAAIALAVAGNSWK